MPRLLRYSGPERPLAVDPHWDFPRRGAFDDAALRIWRTRISLPGTAPVSVRLELARLADGVAAPLVPAAHVRRLVGHEPLLAEAWAAIPGDTLRVEPPLLVLGVDLTGLGPGDHRLVARVGADAPALCFRVARRPVYALADRRARSRSGLREIDAGARRFVAAHGWTVLRSAFGEGGYGPPEPVEVTAVTLFDAACRPALTRFRVGALSGPPPTDLTGWLPPASHGLPPASDDPTEGRFGLPFPWLPGLLEQPRETGTYPSGGSRRAAQGSTP